MSETLLSPSRIALFGRVVEDLKIAPVQTGEAASPGLLQQRLRAEDACFARIYGFSYEGLFHVLPRSALLLVDGQGEPAGAEQHSGLDAARGSTAALPEGLQVWAYDKGDYSMLLEVHSGTLDQLLLQGEGPDIGMSLRGMSLQGMSVRGMSAPGPRSDDKAD